MAKSKPLTKSLTHLTESDEELALEIFKIMV